MLTSTAFALPLWPSKLGNPCTRPFSFTLRQPPPTALIQLFTRIFQLKPMRPQSQSGGQTDPRPQLPQTRKSEQHVDLPSEKPSPSLIKTINDLPLRPDPNIVLVLGASGLLGREIVKELLKQPGCIVIACVRYLSEATEAGLDDLALRVAQPRPESDTGHRPAKLRFLVSELSVNISYIAEEAKRLSVGTIVFAAAGGRISKPSEIDNIAVRSLAKAMEPYLGANGEARELVLFDFEESPTQALAAFCSVDDRVMGGISKSSMVISEESKTARFQGNVTTANNGGFAQVRGDFGKNDLGQSVPMDLSNYAGIMIRCRGDGRRYKINLKDDEQPEFVFQTSFGTVRGEWQTVRLSFSEFIPVRRGRIVYGDEPGSGIYASVLNTAKILSVGIVVSKIEPGGGVTPGFESGSFDLELSQITAFRACTPRFLLVSSAAVTRPFWSEERKKQAPSAAEIPIVELNPSNILGHKLAGENAVRRGSIPWAIVRPTGLNDQVASGRKLLLRQGDTLTGTLSRADAARGVVSALRSHASTWKTFELGADNVQEDKENMLTEADFVLLTRDILESQYREETDHLV